MGLSDDFLWGGATAANQAEGGVLAGGRGLSNVDLLPTGPDRAKVAAGELEMLEWQEKFFYSPSGHSYVPPLYGRYCPFCRNGV